MRRSNRRPSSQHRRVVECDSTNLWRNLIYETQSSSGSSFFSCASFHRFENPKSFSLIYEASIYRTNTFQTRQVACSKVLRTMHDTRFLRNEILIDYLRLKYHNQVQSIHGTVNFGYLSRFRGGIRSIESMKSEILNS